MISGCAAMFAMTLAVTSVSCGDTVAAGGDGGPSSDARPDGATDGSPRDGRAQDGRADATLDAGRAGDGSDDGAADSCVPLKAERVDASKLTSCDPYPCGQTEFCVDWVQTHKGPSVLADCKPLPASCSLNTCNPTTTCVCVEVWGQSEACFSPESCTESEAGAIVVTCEIPPPP